MGNVKFKRGDLVYIVGANADDVGEHDGRYVYTRDGSWGYFLRYWCDEDTGGEEDVYVDWVHLTGAPRHPRVSRAETGRWGIEQKYLRRLDNPPKKRTEITSLVATLARLTGAL